MVGQNDKIWFQGRRWSLWCVWLRALLNKMPSVIQLWIHDAPFPWSHEKSTPILRHARGTLRRVSHFFNTPRLCNESIDSIVQRILPLQKFDLSCSSYKMRSSCTTEVASFEYSTLHFEAYAVKTVSPMFFSYRPCLVFCLPPASAFFSYGWQIIGPYPVLLILRFQGLDYEWLCLSSPIRSKASSICLLSIQCSHFMVLCLLRDVQFSAQSDRNRVKDMELPTVACGIRSEVPYLF